MPGVAHPISAHAMPMPRGSELLTMWLAHKSIGKCEREILGVLYDVGGGELTHEEIRARTPSQYSFSGSFQNALSRLRTLGLLHGPNTGAMRIDSAFLE